MKKRLIKWISVLILLCLWTPAAFAQEEITYETIDIVLQIGSDTVHINGESSKIEEPYISNGATLVPLRVITEAFGAKVGWDQETRTVDLELEGDRIELTIEEPIAFVNGMAVKLQALPELKNGTTMVPIRMISENFGAAVNYEATTKTITIRKAVKQFIGDSYYNWYMKYPDYLILDYQSELGDKVRFTDVNEEYDLFIEAIYVDSNQLSKDEVTFEEAFEQVFETVFNSENTAPYVFDTRIVSDGEKSYAQAKSKIEDELLSYVEVRFYYDYDSSLIYEVTLYVHGAQIYENKSDFFEDLLDSFTIGYQATESIKDLAVVEEGYLTFRDEAYGITGKLPLDWTHYREPRLIKTAQNYFSYSVSEIQEGHSLEEWLDLIDFDYELEYGIPFRKLSDFRMIEGRHFFGASGTNIKEDLYLEEEKLITDIYIFKGNYKYHFEIGFSLDMPDAERLNIMETIIGSLSIGEIHPSTEIRSKEYYFIEEHETETVVYTNDKYGFQIEVPIYWKVEEEPSSSRLDYLWAIRSEGGFGSIELHENESFEDKLDFYHRLYSNPYFEGAIEVNGLPAHYFIAPSITSGITIYYFIKVDDDLLLVYFSLDNNYFYKSLQDQIDAIVKSIRPIQ